MPHLKKPHTFGLYSTSKQSHMKVGSKNRCLGLGLIKMLINQPSFELGLMVGPKTRFSVWHRRMVFTLIPLTNLFNMSSLICWELFCPSEDNFDDLTVTCRNYHLYPDQPAQVFTCVFTTHRIKNIKYSRTFYQDKSVKYSTLLTALDPRESIFMGYNLC